MPIFMTSMVLGILMLTSVLFAIPSLTGPGMNNGVGAGFATATLLLIVPLILTPLFFIGFNIPLIWNKKYVRAELFALQTKNSLVIFQKIILWTVWVTGEAIGFWILSILIPMISYYS